MIDSNEEVLLYLYVENKSPKNIKIQVVDWIWLNTPLVIIPKNLIKKEYRTKDKNVLLIPFDIDLCFNYAFIDC